MRFIKLLGLVVILYGLSYLLQAGRQIVSGSFDIVRVLVIGLNLTIGFVTLVNGIGLFRIRPWSRIAWLVTVIALVLEHALILLLWYLFGLELTLPVLLLLLVFFLAVLSWVKLSDESIKKHFG